MPLDLNPYSLWEILIASTDAEATAYGTPVTLFKDQMFTVTPVHDTDQQRDSGQVTSSLSIATHADLTIQAGGIPMEAGITMLGAASSTSDDIITIRRYTATNRPYFGALGVAPTEDDRILVVGLYKAQIQGDPEINFDGTTNAWITSEMSAIALAKASVMAFDKWKVYPDLETWETDKPTDGTDFLAWFA
jgi:hypothetical protein